MENQPASHLTFFADHLDAQYGKLGAPRREEFEKEFEAFKLETIPLLTRNSHEIKHPQQDE